MLMFSLLAVVVLLNYERSRKQVLQRPKPKTLQATQSQISGRSESLAWRSVD